MMSPREGSPRRKNALGRQWALWAGLAVGGTLPTLVGCQVEYAGMTLPSGKYMLMAKGADNVMFDRARPDKTRAVLNDQLTAFASTGLRTLVLARGTLVEDRPRSGRLAPIER